MEPPPSWSPIPSHASSFHVNVFLWGCPFRVRAGICPVTYRIGNYFGRALQITAENIYFKSLLCLFIRLRPHDMKDDRVEWNSNCLRRFCGNSKADKEKLFVSHWQDCTHRNKLHEPTGNTRSAIYLFFPQFITSGIYFLFKIPASYGRRRSWKKIWDAYKVPRRGLSQVCRIKMERRRGILVLSHPLRMETVLRVVHHEFVKSLTLTWKADSNNYRRQKPLLFIFSLGKRRRRRKR